MIDAAATSTEQQTPAQAPPAAREETLRLRRDARAKNAALEAEVRRRVREFDVIALLELVEHMGYRKEEVLFQSHLSNATQGGLVHRIDFVEEPVRQCVITLNMGLLSPHSPLPSYFQKLLEDASYDEDALLGFIGFFDHNILARFLASIYPETDPGLHPSWEATKRNYLALTALRSTSTLHWLFHLVFPELGVTVNRGTLARRMRMPAATLGRMRLGEAGALGGTSTVPLPGVEVMLFSEESDTDAGAPWAREVRERLERWVFPILAETALELRVALTIRSQRGWARLGPGSYLGFDRIRGGAERDRVIEVHRGQCPH